MKKFLLVLVFLLLCGKGFASFVPNIPQTTLQIAKDAEIKSILENPQPQKVRVGIGDNAFKMYDYDTTSIFATSDAVIFSNNQEIAKVIADYPVKVTLKDGQFQISADGHTITTTGTVRFVCPKGLLGVSGLKRVGKQALYRGELQLIRYNKKPTRFHIVNVLGIEDYLKGVVPNEMPVRFGLEALKAQSVAARNYVLSPRIRAYSAFDVVDSVASQVYFGANSEKELGTRAVNETEGIVAIYNWDLILAQYSSTAGGYTESFSNAFSDPKTKAFPSLGKPYLIAKPDIETQKPLNNEEEASKFYKSTPMSYDIQSPYYRWQRTWSKEELQKAIQNNLAAQSSAGFVHPSFKVGDKLDEITKLEVKRRGNSGKIIELEIVTKGQNYKVYKEIMIRRLLTCQGKALPSANVVFEHTFDEQGNLLSVTGFGGGFGHGVGMSQFGAGYMATQLHKSYDKILKHYYTGITLATKPVILSAWTPNIMQTFYTKNRYAKIIVDNKYQLSYFLVNINGRERKFELNDDFFNRIKQIDISEYIRYGKNEIVFKYPLENGKNKGLRLFVELVARDDNN